MKTVALCGVSTGVYGFPLNEAADIALRTTREFIDEHSKDASLQVFLLKSFFDELGLGSLTGLYSVILAIATCRCTPN